MSLWNSEKTCQRQAIHIPIQTCACRNTTDRQKLYKHSGPVSASVGHWPTTLELRCPCFSKHHIPVPKACLSSRLPCRRHRVAPCTRSNATKACHSVPKGERMLCWLRESASLRWIFHVNFDTCFRWIFGINY